jgi:hypothetical protein
MLCYAYITLAQIHKTAMNNGQTASLHNPPFGIYFFVEVKKKGEVVPVLD